MTAQGDIHKAETQFENGGTAFDPTGVTISILDPTAHLVVTAAMPTRIATGLYVYNFVVPADAPLGTWRERWGFTIGTSALGFDNAFEVTLGGPLSIASDWEAVVVAYLLSRGELASVCAGGGTAIPPAPSFPRWRLHLIGGVPDFPGWVVHPRFQVEAWGGTKQQANLLIQTLEAAIQAMPETPFDAGIVTDSTVQLSRLWSPDPTTGRPRYLSDFQLTAHPLPK